MGEIVRVLKWRLDLDSAGMAEGLGKAADQAERFKKSTEGLGDTGASGVKKVKTETEGATTAFEGLGFEAQQVEMYVSRLEKGSGSPLVLKRNAELAEAAFNVLAASAQKAGQAIPEVFSDRVAGAISKATTQAAGMNAELEKMGGQTPTKLDKVITALEKTEASAGGAWAAIRKMGEEGARAAAALEKMEKASDSPRELARTAALAELEMNQLRASIDKARVSGVALGPDLGNSLSKAASSITAANTRAAQMRDTLGDMKTRGDLAAKGFEATAGAAGSLEGMLGRLNDTGTATQRRLAEVGFAIVAVAAAAKLGYESGLKMREVLTGMGVPLPNLSEGLAEVSIDLEKFANHGDRTITLGTMLKDTLFNLATGTHGLGDAYRDTEAPETAAMSRARAFLALRESQAKSEQALAAAFKASGLAWKSDDAARDALIAKLNAAEMALSRVTDSQEEWTATVKKNSPELKKLGDEAALLGVNMNVLAPRTAAAAKEAEKYADAVKKAEEDTKTFADTQKKVGEVLSNLIPRLADSTRSYEENEAVVLAMADANKVSLSDLEKMIAAEATRQGATGKSKDAYDALLAAIKRLIASGVDTTTQIDKERAAREKLTEQIRKEEAAADAALNAKKARWALEDARGGTGGNNFSAPVVDGLEKERQAAIGAAAANGEFGTSLDVVAQKVVSLGGSLTVGQPILMEVKEATEQARASILALAEAYGTLRAAQVETLADSPRMMDYLIAVKKGYDDGVTSLGSYIQTLIAYKSQLEQMFAGATGAAKESITALEDMILSLMNNIGPRETYSPGYLGDLERSLAKNKEK